MSAGPASRSSDLVLALLAFLVIAIASGMALFCLVPPAVVPKAAPPGEFSAARAFEHLKVIAREPHPTGAARNAEVRDYLIQQLKGTGPGSSSSED